MKSSLLWCPADAVTRADIELLATAGAAAPLIERLTELDLMHSLQRGTRHLFRLREPAEGLILTEVRVGAEAEKRLVVVRAAGRGVVRSLPSILRDLAALGAHWGCKGVETLAYDPRLVRALERAGCTPEAVAFVIPALERNT